MKKRAILTAESYDEFKNLVACATLEPISSKEYNFHHEHVPNAFVHKDEETCIVYGNIYLIL